MHRTKRSPSFWGGLCEMHSVFSNRYLFSVAEISTSIQESTKTAIMGLPLTASKPPSSCRSSSDKRSKVSLRSKEIFFRSYFRVSCEQGLADFEILCVWCEGHRERFPVACVSRQILLESLDLGAKRGWVVSTTPRPLYPRERPGTHCGGG
jgi:hypothetical protein